MPWAERNTIWNERRNLLSQYTVGSIPTLLIVRRKTDVNLNLYLVIHIGKVVINDNVIIHEIS